MPDHNQSPPNPPDPSVGTPMPKASWMSQPHWLALLLVILTLTPMALWPALQTFRPVTHVKVARALPAIIQVADPSAVQDETASPPPTRTVQAPGWIEPDPYYTAVTALADGVVASVHVLEGESVTQGQLMATLVAEDAELALRQAEARLETMKAALVRARAELAAATTDWEQPVQRERAVAATAAALVEAQAELKRLPAETRALEADLERWREEHQRVIQAFERGAATTRERLVVEYELASSESALEALRLRAGVLEARVERLQAESTAAARGADLRVEERLALDRASAAVSDAEGALEEARAQRDEASLRLDRMSIVSPMDGHVLKRLKVPGDKVMLGMDGAHSAHVFHLYDPQRLQVRVDVPLADASQIRVGQTCEVVVDVLTDRVFAGEVSRITHQADLQKNTLQIKVRVLDPVDLLKPEMLTRVRFIGGNPATHDTQQPAGAGTNAKPSTDAANTRPNQRVRIPEDCMDDDRVWVVRDRRGLEGLTHPTPVRPVSHGDGFVTVEGPLSVGDLVVQQPAGLSRGERVEVSLAKGGVL